MAVVADLEMEIGAYPHRFLTFEVTRVHLKGLRLNMCAPQHSIRRFEFDHWLLERSGAQVLNHKARRIERRDGRFVIDDRFECEYLVGAGGTACPVYRGLFREVNPRARTLQAVALEQELPCEWRDGDCHLWFFHKGLPGYSWYVPKADGYLNLGVGAMAARLKDRGDDIRPHWDRFEARLRGRGLIDGGLELAPQGYAYYLRDGVQRLRLDKAFVIGDAAGLATRDMAEGIGPAVRSGLLAAEAIAGEADYTLETIAAHSLPAGLPRHILEYKLLGRS